MTIHLTAITTILLHFQILASLEQNINPRMSKHCFKGIVKSQMIRLRRLCSRDSDFVEAIAKLRQRCINSGYDVTMVDEILGQARELTPWVRTRSCEDETHYSMVCAFSNCLRKNELRISLAGSIDT